MVSKRVKTQDDAIIQCETEAVPTEYLLDAPGPS